MNTHNKNPNAGMGLWSYSEHKLLIKKSFLPSVWVYIDRVEIKCLLLFFNVKSLVIFSFLFSLYPYLVIANSQSVPVLASLFNFAPTAWQ